MRRSEALKGNAVGMYPTMHPQSSLAPAPLAPPPPSPPRRLIIASPLNDSSSSASQDNISNTAQVRRRQLSAEQSERVARLEVGWKNQRDAPLSGNEMQYSQISSTIDSNQPGSLLKGVTYSPPPPQQQRTRALLPSPSLYDSTTSNEEDTISVAPHGPDGWKRRIVSPLSPVSTSSSATPRDFEGPVRTTPALQESGLGSIESGYTSASNLNVRRTAHVTYGLETPPGTTTIVSPETGNLVYLNPASPTRSSSTHSRSHLGSPQRARSPSPKPLAEDPDTRMSSYMGTARSFPRKVYVPSSLTSNDVDSSDSQLDISRVTFEVTNSGSNERFVLTTDIQSLPRERSLSGVRSRRSATRVFRNAADSSRSSVASSNRATSTALARPQSILRRTQNTVRHPFSDSDSDEKESQMSSDDDTINYNPRQRGNAPGRSTKVVAVRRRSPSPRSDQVQHGRLAATRNVVEPDRSISQPLSSPLPVSNSEDSEMYERRTKPREYAGERGHTILGAEGKPAQVPALMLTSSSSPSTVVDVHPRRSSLLDRLAIPATPAEFLSAFYELQFEKQCEMVWEMEEANRLEVMEEYVDGMRTILLGHSLRWTQLVATLTAQAAASSLSPRSRTASVDTRGIQPDRCKTPVRRTFSGEPVEEANFYQQSPAFAHADECNIEFGDGLVSDSRSSIRPFGISRDYAANYRDRINSLQFEGQLGMRGASSIPFNASLEMTPRNGSPAPRVRFAEQTSLPQRVEYGMAPRSTPVYSRGVGSSGAVAAAMEMVDRVRESMERALTHTLDALQAEAENRHSVMEEECSAFLFLTKMNYIQTLGINPISILLEEASQRQRLLTQLRMDVYNYRRPRTHDTKHTNSSSRFHSPILHPRAEAVDGHSNALNNSQFVVGVFSQSTGTMEQLAGVVSATYTTLMSSASKRNTPAVRSYALESAVEDLISEEQSYRERVDLSEVRERTALYMIHLRAFGVRVKHDSSNAAGGIPSTGTTTHPTDGINAYPSAPGLIHGSGRNATRSRDKPVNQNHTTLDSSVECLVEASYNTFAQQILSTTATTSPPPHRPEMDNVDRARIMAEGKKQFTENLVTLIGHRAEESQNRTFEELLRSRSAITTSASQSSSSSAVPDRVHNGVDRSGASPEPRTTDGRLLARGSPSTGTSSSCETAVAECLTESSQESEPQRPASGKYRRGRDGDISHGPDQMRTRAAQRNTDSLDSSNVSRRSTDGKKERSRREDTDTLHHNHSRGDSPESRPTKGETHVAKRGISSSGDAHGCRHRVPCSGGYTAYVGSVLDIAVETATAALRQRTYRSSTTRSGGTHLEVNNSPRSHSHSPENPRSAQNCSANRDLLPNSNSNDSPDESARELQGPLHPDGIQRDNVSPISSAPYDSEPRTPTPPPPPPLPAEQPKDIRLVSPINESTVTVLRTKGMPTDVNPNACNTTQPYSAQQNSTLATGASSPVLTEDAMRAIRSMDDGREGEQPHRESTVTNKSEETRRLKSTRVPYRVPLQSSSSSSTSSSSSGSSSRNSSEERDASEEKEEDISLDEQRLPENSGCRDDVDMREYVNTTSDGDSSASSKECTPKSSPRRDAHLLPPLARPPSRESLSNLAKREMIESEDEGRTEPHASSPIPPCTREMADAPQNALMSADADVSFPDITPIKKVSEDDLSAEIEAAQVAKVRAEVVDDSDDEESVSFHDHSDEQEEEDERGEEEEDEEDGTDDYGEEEQTSGTTGGTGSEERQEDEEEEEGEEVSNTPTSGDGRVETAILSEKSRSEQTLSSMDESELESDTDMRKEELARQIREVNKHVKTSPGRPRGDSYKLVLPFMQPTVSSKRKHQSENRTPARQLVVDLSTNSCTEHEKPVKIPSVDLSWIVRELGKRELSRLTCVREIMDAQRHRDSASAHRTEIRQTSTPKSRPSSLPSVQQEVRSDVEHQGSTERESMCTDLVAQTEPSAGSTASSNTASDPICFDNDPVKGVCGVPQNVAARRTPSVPSHRSSSRPISPAALLPQRQRLDSGSKARFGSYVEGLFRDTPQSVWYKEEALTGELLRTGTRTARTKSMITSLDPTITAHRVSASRVQRSVSNPGDRGRRSASIASSGESDGTDLDAQDLGGVISLTKENDPFGEHSGQGEWMDKYWSRTSLILSPLHSRRPPEGGMRSASSKDRGSAQRRRCSSNEPRHIGNTTGARVPRSSGSSNGSRDSSSTPLRQVRFSGHGPRSRMPSSHRDGDSAKRHRNNTSSPEIHRAGANGGNGPQGFLDNCRHVRNCSAVEYYNTEEQLRVMCQRPLRAFEHFSNLSGDVGRDTNTPQRRRHSPDILESDLRGVQEGSTSRTGKPWR